MLSRPLWSSLAIAGAIAAVASAYRTSNHAPRAPLTGTYSTRVAPIAFQSIGVMHFGPDATLYVADSRAGAIYAIDVGEAGRDTSTELVSIKGIDAKIAELVGVSKDDIRIHDMVAHPRTQSVYLSVTKGHGDRATSLIARVTKADKKISILSTDMIRHARVELPDAASRDTTLPWEGAPRSLTITHLAADDHQLYVAGLSNEEFKSTLRRVPLPIGPSTITTHVEIFHTAHNRFETASPIESILALSLHDKPIVLASYSCSPLAVFDRDALNGHGIVRGKTVAEMGGGNRPLDMIAYKSPTDGKQYMMVANSDRTLMRFDLDELASAPGMTTAVKQAYQPGGVPYLPVSSFGVLQLDSYNAKNVILLQRDPDSGSLDLASRDLMYL